jgi:hypothetical protein
VVLRSGGLRREQLEAERRDHGFGDLVLHREHVGELAVVGLRPEVVAVGGIDEPGGDAHLVAGLAHAAFEQRSDVELLADAPHILVLSFEGEGRRARGDVQPRHLGEQVEQLLGEAVGEVLLVGGRGSG